MLDPVTMWSVLTVAFVWMATASVQRDFSGPNCQVSSFDNGVFIAHEGNFLGGNASLSFLNKNNGTMANGVFTAVNTIPLGDVAQSMTIYGDKGYIVVNNSGKIEVVNLDDLSSAGTITGLSSPRYVSIVSSSKAYVSDLFSGAITIFDPQTLATSGTIAVSGQVDEMVITTSGVIAAGTGANQVYRINTSTNTIEDSVAVGIGPANLRVDANGKVWVLTNGGWGSEVPKLVRVNQLTCLLKPRLIFHRLTIILETSRLMVLELRFFMLMARFTKWT